MHIQSNINIYIYLIFLYSLYENIERPSVASEGVDLCFKVKSGTNIKANAKYRNRTAEQKQISNHIDTHDIKTDSVVLVQSFYQLRAISVTYCTDARWI